MDKIIFLDIDGVLNTTHSFQENWNYKKLYDAIYPFIESYLIKSGIPVVDYIQSFSDRGEKIQEYIHYNNIEKFIILDDSVFKGYYPIIDRLIWTNFYDGGLTYELANDAIYKLR